MNERIGSTNPNHAIPLPPKSAAMEQHPNFIEWAYQCSENVGTTIDHFLIRNGLVSAEHLYQILASILNVPFTTAMLPIADHLDGEILIRAEICQLSSKGEKPRFAMAPSGKKFVALLFAASLGTLQFNVGNVLMTTPQNFVQSVRRHNGHAIAQRAVNKMRKVAPHLSAHQKGMNVSACLSLFFAFFLFLSVMSPSIWHSSVFLLTLFPGIPSIVLKAAAVRRMSNRSPRNLTLVDQDLPNYTILVPLYREKKIISKLIERLKKIDYPKAKLEIKILVEMDDIETRLALIMEELPAIFDIIVCPLMNPRTKPRALNVGLAYAKGDYIVIYDAEDEPDPDQLKKAATCFYHGGKRLGCVQGRLAIDNMADGWISRMFALEYASLFDALLPGMSNTRQPIPLGGTSNHFRRSTLEACFAWDPWNVTEDADLGLRLARLGYETAVIDSTTWEEAPNTIKAWLNQRTRWLKGWMQTAMVIARPLGLKQAKTSRAMQFQIAVISLSSITSAMFHPLAVIAFGWVITTHSMNDSISLLGIIQWSFIGFVFVCHCIVSYITMRAGMRCRGLKFHILDCISLVLYSLLKCVAAWRALWEFIVAPSLWRKTEHGHSRTSRRMATKIS